MNSKTAPHDVIHTALQSLDISLDHSQQCLDEAANWLQDDGLDDPELVDLTHLPFVTIDNEDSRDLDQALFIESTTDAGYRVFYALADASYYVKPGSALFNEALLRGTTYYTPLLAAAMLPTQLSEGLISLNPEVTRRALVFDMKLNADATVSNCTIVRAKICSQAKLSYSGVQQWLDADAIADAITDPNADAAGATDGDATNTLPYHQSLRNLKVLGNLLITTSEKRGVIQFDRQSTQISIAGTPPCLQATVRERFETERYNEQISLLCNMQGAELLLGLAGVTDVVQSIFRVHEAPLKKSLNQLKATLDTFADSQDEPYRWRWNKDQSLANYVQELPEDEVNVRRVRAIQRQIMQAQRGSTFTPEPGEHHALKVNSYARFSSPMREVVGIFTHKELLEALSGELFDNDADDKLREQVIDAANNARQRQRKLDKQIEFAALHSVFDERLNAQTSGWQAGTVVGVRTDKLYISLDDMALDVKIYRDDIDTAFSTTYTMDNISAKPFDTTNAPTWTLGEGLQLRVTLFDEARQRFVFTIRSLTSAEQP